MDLVADSESTTDVPREDGRRETVLGVVGHPDDVGLVLELGDGDDYTRGGQMEKGRRGEWRMEEERRIVEKRRREESGERRGGGKRVRRTSSLTRRGSGRRKDAGRRAHRDRRSPPC